MNSSIKASLFLPALIVGIAGVAGSYYIWTQFERAALLSCIQSIGSDVAEYSRLDKFAKDGENWYVLSNEESSGALEIVPFGGCKGRFTHDIKAGRIKIAVRKLDKYGYKVRVWSTGIDDISGTKDDIVFPYGEEAIK